nr:hypothetical protein [Mycoplasma haemocanis]
MPNFKFVKVGGPIFTGIGGVFATSSLISKSAEEKQEEKLKTKALKDEDPLIKDWKDRNESEQGSESDGSQSSSDGDQSDSSESNSNGSEGTESSSGQSSDSPDASKSEEGSPQSSEGGTEDEGDAKEGGEDEDPSDSSSGKESSGSGVTTEGTSDASHDHALGTRFGTRDAGMTKQELERTTQTRNELQDWLDKLKGMQ